MTDSAPRFAVGVIGVGRAGGPLAAALDRAGHRVVAVHAVSETSRLRAELLVPRARPGTVHEVVAQADLLLLTVPDDVLPGLVTGLAADTEIRPGQVVVHASGRFGVGVLDPLTELGALPLALHPAMTLTGTSLDVQRLSGCPFGVTAPEALRPMAEALVVEMGGEPFWVDDDARELYHAALAHGANHLVTLTAQALAALSEAGVDDPARLLGPLLRAALDNTLERGDHALTGPVVRGDAGTVTSHLAALDEADSDTARVYRVLARATAERALAAGNLPADRAAPLLQALAHRDPQGTT